MFFKLFLNVCTVTVRPAVVKKRFIGFHVKNNFFWEQISIAVRHPGGFVQLYQFYVNTSSIN